MQITKEEAIALASMYLSEGRKHVLTNRARIDELMKYGCSDTAPQDTGNLSFVIGMLENLAEGEFRFDQTPRPFYITKRYLTPGERKKRPRPDRSLKTLLKESIKEAKKGKTAGN